MTDRKVIFCALLIATFIVFTSDIAHASSVLYSSNAGGCGNVYTVRAGDTLGGIAAKCGVSLNNLLASNGLRVTSIIYPGQRLVIAGAAAASSGSAPVMGCPNPYSVQPGDTLSRIAARCGVSVGLLKQWNGLAGDIIRVGQLLMVRGEALLTPRPAPSPLVPTRVPAARYVQPAPLATPCPTATPPIESTIALW